MKFCRNLLFTVIILLLFNLIDKKCNGQEKDTQSILLESLEKTDIFNALFKQEVLDWCIWKPSVADSLFPVSEDGFCHTRLDTIIIFQQNYSHKALLIFATYELIDGHLNNSHYYAPYLSIAIFVKDERNKWLLEKFEKNFGEHGSWGILPTLTITKIGNHFFLKEDWGYTSQGVTEGWNIFYHLPSLTQSLRISSIDERGTGWEESHQEDWSEELQDISTGGITKVLITKKGNLNKGQGIVLVNESKTLVLNDSFIFIPVE